MNVDIALKHPANDTLLDSLASLQRPGALPVDGPTLAFRIDGHQQGSPDEDEQTLRDAIRSGDRFSAVTLGARLISTDGAESNLHEGEHLLRNAADKDNLLAQTRLAAHLLSGRHLTQNRELGLRWLRRAGAITPAQIARLASYLWGKSVATHRKDSPLLAEEAAILCEEAIRQEYLPAQMILAYLIRRREIVADARPSLNELLSGHVQKNQPFALVNQALRLARGIQCTMDWTEADAVFGRIATSEEILDWWYSRSREGDAEGHLVVGWLDRHTLTIDPDGLSVYERWVLARRDGWMPPDWIMMQKKIPKIS